MDSKTLLLSLLAIAGTGLFLLTQSPAQNQSSGDLFGARFQTKAAFRAFGAEHAKDYASPAEAEFRFRVFAEKAAKIAAHNADPSSTYKLEINQFTDMTWEELKAKYLVDFSASLRFQGPSKCEKTKFDLSAGFSAEPDVDWIAKGKVQKVKNQGRCGSCWAFSSTGALESAYAIFKGELPSLSEQELVDCSREYGNEGCNGGEMYPSFDYILEHHINNDKDYPYVGRNQKCRAVAGKGQYGLTGCVQVQSDVKALVQAINQQPVSVAFYVQDDFFSYHSGVYNPRTCGGEPNHAVLAVGYHLDSNPKKAYFLVKNSWGTRWGDQGFFKIAIGEGHGTCRIAGTDSNYFPTL